MSRCMLDLITPSVLSAVSRCHCHVTEVQTKLYDWWLCYVHARLWRVDWYERFIVRRIGHFVDMNSWPKIGGKSRSCDSKSRPIFVGRLFVGRQYRPIFVDRVSSALDMNLTIPDWLLMQECIKDSTRLHKTSNIGNSSHNTSNKITMCVIRQTTYSSQHC